ncbi:MAG TPA: DnaJ domain-containing protein [Candidatus Nanopelagicales bacterium]|nr:DnaJ domain-containing protein [Candidatus Nanopelagicales bacterium]
MLLPSRLSTSTLGDLLGALHRQGTTGLLELCELWAPGGAAVPGRQHRVQLYAGLVTAVETPLPAPRLGELLERRGALSSAAVARIAAINAARVGRLTGEQLVDAGLASREAVERALRAQLRARLDALFTLEEASICFHTARPLTDSLRRVGPLGPTDFLHGRPRARDRRRPGAWSPPRPEPSRASSSYSSSYSPPPPPPPPPSRTVRVDERRLRALQLLGLREGATDADVRRAFRRIAARVHPDRGPGGDTGAFAELSAAYHLLVA